MTLSEAAFLVLNIASTIYDFRPAVVPVASLAILLIKWLLCWGAKVFSPSVRARSLNCALSTCEDSLINNAEKGLPLGYAARKKRRAAKRQLSRLSKAVTKIQDMSVGGPPWTLRALWMFYVTRTFSMLALELRLHCVRRRLTAARSA
ncbi:hypothetical protein CYLTODRAFT_171382 [Cylindrobasidium torrendii FP15055 ss-10]|uniref:Uncharacterized protein n=1 Tax=Cylindrobasidium torrendii FP15055 ss-10 TaxID=1314674 RepID=A0A0D7BM76_9AGAR|nr:hypothetical protein CYLTODRAFT_171382 [Cylindrobasidium torrendii FP15055 ss-10]